jgi:hypothetical protein
MDTNLNVQSPNEQVRSIYERFHPRMLWLADKVATQSRQKNDLGSLFYNAKELGMTPDDQERTQLETQLQQKTQMFVDATKELDDSAYEQAAQKFMQEQAAPYPQRQTAQLQNPNAMQSAFAILGAVLDPKNAAQTVSQPFLHQSQDQQVRQGQMDQQFGDEVRQRGERINTAETLMNLEDRKLGRAQSSQDRQASIIDRQIRDIQTRMEKLDQRSQMAVEKAYSAYNAANTPSEKRIAGARLQAVLAKSMPELVPSDEEIMSAVQELQNQNSRFASQEWEKALSSELNLFGEVNDARAGELDTQRIAIANRYGIDPANLRTTPTGKTIAAQKLALTQQQFSFLKTKTAEDFKIKWANLQVARQRAETYAQAVANGFALGGVRNQISAGHLTMRQYEASIKAAGTGAKAEMMEMLGKIKKESDPEKAAKLRADLNLFIQNTAEELGLTPEEVFRDPLGAIDRLIKGMDEQQPQQDTPDLSGFIGPNGTKLTANPNPNIWDEPKKPASKPKPVRKPTPKKQAPKLPSGWKGSF